MTDDLDDDDVGIDPALAAAMGFSAFGGQPSSKRRKYNDGAMVDGQLPREGGHKGNKQVDRGSGANNTALGARKKADVPHTPRDVSATSGEAPGGEVRKDTAQETQSVPSGGIVEGDKGAKKAKGKKKEDAGAGLAGFLARAKELPARPSETQGADNVAPIAKEEETSVAFRRDTWEEHQTGQRTADVGTSQRHDLSAYRRGVRNERGT